MSIRRVARKQHSCSVCHGQIAAGDAYVETKLFPRDNWFAWRARQPLAYRECAACAQRFGRGHLLATPEAAS